LRRTDARSVVGADEPRAARRFPAKRQKFRKQKIDGLAIPDDPDRAVRESGGGTPSFPVNAASRETKICRIAQKRVIRLRRKLYFSA
jgi:hypothetical protein